MRSPAPSTRAFGDIYRSHASFVWLTLQRLGVRERDREDLCHDVFLVAYEKLSAYVERSSIRSWLFAICLRLSANYRRKAAVRFEHSVDPFEEDATSSAAPRSVEPDAVLSRREAYARARTIVDRMHPLQRVVFVMYEIEGIRCDVIASELGVPLGTVYSRLHAARRLFRDEAARR